MGWFSTLLGPLYQAVAERITGKTRQRAELTDALRDVASAEYTRSIVELQKARVDLEMARSVNRLADVLAARSAPRIPAGDSPALPPADDANHAG